MNDLLISRLVRAVPSVKDMLLCSYATRRCLRCHSTSRVMAHFILSRFALFV